MTTPQQPQDQRRKIRVTGKESVADVARVVFKDPRLAPLICDLNASLPVSGPIAAGVVVTVPSKAEAQAFAKKMGLTLGFDERGTNGTRQKRAWAKLKGPGQASHAGIDPADAGRKLLEQKVAAAEVGKRLVKLCTPEALERFLAAPPEDAALLPVWKSVELHVGYPKAHARIGRIIAVLDATLRPAGLLALLQAIVVDDAAADAVLAAVLAPAPAREALKARAAGVVRLVARARELAKIERGARDATLRVDKDAAILAALVAAIVDRVDPVSGDRLKILGLDEAWGLLSTHLTRLKEMMKKQDEVLPRAGADVIKVLAAGADGGKLPKPWPLIAAVVRGLAPALDAAGVGAVDEGLGGLVKKPAPAPSTSPPSSGPLTAEGGALRSMEGGPVISAASLQARAASGARAVDEGSAIAERLSPGLIALLDVVRPLSGDVGPAPMRRAKRKSHYDDIMSAKSAPQADAIAVLVDEIFADARRVGLAGIERVQRPQQQAAREVGKALTGPLSWHQKPVSELARALLVVAMAVDRELGALLLRPTGREAFRAAVEKHGGKLLSKAGLVYAEPPAK